MQKIMLIPCQLLYNLVVGPTPILVPPRKQRLSNLNSIPTLSLSLCGLEMAVMQSGAALIFAADPLTSKRFQLAWIKSLPGYLLSIWMVWSVVMTQ